MPLNGAAASVEVFVVFVVTVRWLLVWCMSNVASQMPQPEKNTSRILPRRPKGVGLGLANVDLIKSLTNSNNSESELSVILPSDPRSGLGRLHVKSGSRSLLWDLSTFQDSAKATQGRAGPCPRQIRNPAGGITDSDVAACCEPKPKWP